jgi:hypothetical protein
LVGQKRVRLDEEHETGDYTAARIDSDEPTDARGLTSVYVDPIQRAFRREQLITLRERRLILQDPERLQAI